MFPFPPFVRPPPPPPPPRFPHTLHSQNPERGLPHRTPTLPRDLLRHEFILFCDLKRHSRVFSQETFAVSVQDLKGISLSSQGCVDQRCACVSHLLISNIIVSPSVCYEHREVPPNKTMTRRLLGSTKGLTTRTHRRRGPARRLLMMKL
jgi:hypothetical protein